MVWVNMLTPDSEAAAKTSAHVIEDPRVRHFYDPNRQAAGAIAQSLGGLVEIAWDIYLFYGRGSEWKQTPPTPTDWVHQLSGADPAHFHSGKDLVKGLYKMVSNF